MEGCYLRCTQCGEIHPAWIETRCKRCGGILEAGYDSADLKGTFEQGSPSLKHGIFRFAAALPPVSPENRVSLAEANTPCIPSVRLAQQLGFANVLFKDETRNPTGSFKDRPISVCVSVAKECGCKRVVVASSGNGAASVAAYSARAGLENAIFVPEGTPDGKVAQALSYGGNVVRVPGDFSNCFKHAIEAAESPGTLNLTTTFLSPFGLEGDKTIAYELFAQTQALPEAVFIPVGAGPILYGIYKGFRELLHCGCISRIPRLIAVQAQGCAPIARAWRTGEKVRAWENASTAASAICDPLRGYEQDGDLTVQAIRESGGAAVVVSDEEILYWGSQLAQCEGLFAEPASAASVAGLAKAKADLGLDKTGTAACILTGSGLKDPSAYLNLEKGGTAC